MSRHACHRTPRSGKFDGALAKILLAGQKETGKTGIFE
jgi:hypothetical protein